MQQLNTLSEIAHYLFHSSKRLITNNVSSFFILNIVHLFILAIFIIINHLIYTNIAIYKLNIGIILLRLSLFSLMIGIWAGYFKLIFNFIDNKTYKIKYIFNYFHLLPKLLLLRLLSYIALIPIMLYILDKFPYDFESHGTNIEEYLMELLENITSTMNPGLDTQAIIVHSNINIFICLILLLIPILYTLKFWTAEFLVIDKEFSIKDAMLISFKINHNFFHLICFGLFILIWSLLTLLLGYIVFIFGLTISYLLITLYYRRLKLIIK